ncbi:hypothetical protein ACJ2A9_21260 [Anaerobacillus sp. MEB173]|uniref:hypothetical protein n=1 Tax=Anaerobacillus sp. MEB173 TaxID=3383345 RepID=UPI003F928D60
MDDKTTLALVRNIIKVGQVNSINMNMGTVRVLFEDRDNSISNDLPVLNSSPMPIVGQQVVCVFLGNAIKDGFCLGGFREGGSS